MVKSYGHLLSVAFFSSAIFCQTALAATPAPQSMIAQAATPLVAAPTLVSFGTLPALQVATPKPGSNYVPGDFNGDGISDILWFNPVLSQVSYWTMTAVPTNATFGGGVTRTGAKTYNVTPGYFVGAVGDFNNDGYADLIFTSANHDLWMWTNDQHGHWQSTEIGTYPDQWQLIGAGDIDGDGYDDLLWFHPSECKFAYWNMHGTVRTGSRIINTTCGYYPIGIGYYQPSNRLSILWSSAASDLYIWDSNGVGFTSYDISFITNNTTSTWTVGGGYMGSNMGFQWNGRDSVSYDGGAVGFSRIFDASGNQTSVQMLGSGWSGGLFSGVGYAGYLIAGNGINQTALYALNQGLSVINTGGLGTGIFSGNSGELLASGGWTYPVGWWVVGAPANGTYAPPWQ
jgi:hypothetical protein